DPVEADAIALATEILTGFAAAYQQAWLAGMARKLGLRTVTPEDRALCDELLAWMQRTGADYTLTFAGLAGAPEWQAPSDDADFTAWHERWTARRAQEALPPGESQALQRAHCPRVIPRNHHVETALAAAVEGSLAPLER